MKKKSFGKLLVFILMVILAAMCLLNGCAGGDNSQKDKASSEQTQAEQEQTAQDEARDAALKQDIANGNLVLVNKQNPVDQDYKADDMEKITDHYASDRSESCRYMRAEAAQAFNAMMEAAAADGVDVVMTTAYRSYDYQNILWTNAVDRKGSEEEANKTSARPGESEHQTGLAVDLSTDEINYEISFDFSDTEAGKWIGTHCVEYGFILRYLDGKTDITGYLGEPWHVRYVGKTAAKEITDQGLTLEEYLQLPDVAALIEEVQGA